MSGGGGARLMSCVREGSLEPPYRPPQSHVAKDGEGRTGRFLRGLRRMFKRRGSASRTDASPDPKSSSTSELLQADAQTRRKEGAYSSGLSVSHDSVFTGERSGDESSDDRPSANVGIGQIISSHRAELVAAVRRRGRGDNSDDDEDLGLPRSPPASPPTDKADKRHHAGISQSSCSDGSLLSVGSSEMDEDSSSLHHHSHETSARSDHSDLYNSSEPPSGVAPLSHSAAKHKMAVRPRRTHGAPRRKKTSPIATSILPITPELNEEILRSATPEVTIKTSEVVTESFSSSSTTKHTIATHQQHTSRDLQRVLEVPNDAKLKSSSLPPGLALSQLVGQTPAKLSIAENNTPRSSIKRSKSNSQDQSLRENNQKTQGSSSETQIHNYQDRVEEKMTKYRKEHKYAEETCHDKKSKSEKKIENEVIKSSKKEESFFSRLLLRKSGKKAKKDQTDGENQQDVKKSKIDKSQYKSVDVEKNMFSCNDSAPPLGPKPVPAERSHKSAGQKVFANQMHKRLDNKGAYTQDNVYKDAYGAAKISSTAGIGYNLSDLKIAEETDRMLNLEMRSRYSRRDDFNEKIDRAKRSSSKDAIDDKREPFSLHHDKSKRPTSVQRLVDPFSSKAFIDNELANAQKEKILSPTLISDEESPIRAIRMPKVQSDYTFHSGSMPKSIPYFNPSIVVSSIPPSKNMRHSSENVKNLHRSSEHVHDLFDKPIQCKHERIHHSTKTEESYVNSAFRSLGDEYVETRSSIGKSHSFRYASESPSISSQESQMPSLPAIVGISEPLLESWEVNYRRNVSDRHDAMKRISARNYNILHNNNDSNYDSLQSTDSSYLDSLKTDANDENKLFTNSIHITMDHHKRDSAISQIEAKIDDIISSPKPIIASILKSSSLDSVKSSPEKQVEDRRKTISVESALSQSGRIHTSIQKELKQETEHFISVTQINRDAPLQAKPSDTKINKSDEKIQKAGGTPTKPGVPEFLKIQLNKVDNKPSNVVLTANVTPKKTETQQVEKETEAEYFEISETKPVSIQNQRDSGGITKVKENITQENTHVENKKSPAVIKKIVNVTPLVTPQSPSTPKMFFKRKSASVESQDKPEKHRTNSMSTDGSTEKIFDNISIDQKSHSSFGSKSSIQSSDSNEIKTPDREETVIFRKKPVISKEMKGDKKNDDEPELMKVFARRSLKLKDCEAESLAQEIAENNVTKDEITDNANANRTKILKNEFNASIKSRDSDKENDETISKEQNEDKRLVDIAARVSQFGAPHYQRSVSISSVSNTNNKRDSAPTYRSEVNKYKKEISDSTPEKRLRNRTFPDPSNDRDDIKSITKTESYKADTLKRPWQKKDEERIRFLSVEKEKRMSTEKESEKRFSLEKEKRLSAEKDKRLSSLDDKEKRTSVEKDRKSPAEDKESGVIAEEEKKGENEAGYESPQFRGIRNVRAEWERRARTQHAK